MSFQKDVKNRRKERHEEEEKKIWPLCKAPLSLKKEIMEKNREREKIKRNENENEIVDKVNGKDKKIDIYPLGLYDTDMKIVENEKRKRFPIGFHNM